MNENNHDGRTIAAPTSVWSRIRSRFAAGAEPSIAHRLYERLVRHARFPLYYDRLAVPDTPEGRFEILALHVALTVRRLAAMDDGGQALSQDLFDLMVADLDMNMRELGVGDLSVGKQVKRLASQFYARLSVLSDAFEGEQADGDRTDALRAMIETNVYGSRTPSPEQLDHLAAIVVSLEAALDREAPDALKAGRLTLPDETALAALG